MANDKLTIKQERYAQGLFAGLSQREAYKQAYSTKNMTDKTIDEEACRIANDYKVSARIKELTDIVTERSIWTVEEILKDIKAIALDPDAKRFEKLKALELGGKHLGMFTDKLDVKSNNLNLNADITQLSDTELEKVILEKAKEIVR
jgi:hypothetical protein